MLRFFDVTNNSDLENCQLTKAHQDKIVEYCKKIASQMFQLQLLIFYENNRGLNR
jgi:hypothetical protein